jgi:hypothetical protein
VAVVALSCCRRGRRANLDTKIVNNGDGECINDDDVDMEGDSQDAEVERSEEHSEQADESHLAVIRLALESTTPCEQSRKPPCCRTPLREYLGAGLAADSRPYTLCLVDGSSGSGCQVI